ncbi:MAG: hypothetical protein HYV65_02140 [Candidatus Spechtbacteria bacterium]|nr:hypothetical protein [Candidatus Spechtbacteria bacterium]
MTDKKATNDSENLHVDNHSAIHLASVTWEEMVRIVRRNLPSHRQVPLDLKDFPTAKEAEEAIKKTSRWKLWRKDGKDLMITRWVPKDPTQTIVVIGSAAIIAASLAMMLKNRKVWDKKIPPQGEKK